MNLLMDPDVEAEGDAQVLYQHKTDRDGFEEKAKE